MNSIGKECNELKMKYEECFNGWFAERFLKGDRQDACNQLFKAYQECVKNAIAQQKIQLWEIEKNVLGTEHEAKVPPKKNK